MHAMEAYPPSTSPSTTLRRRASALTLGLFLASAPFLFRSRTSSSSPDETVIEGGGASSRPKADETKSASSSFVRSSDNDVDAEEANQEHDGLDFLVAGFPKCGTSTLMNTFSAHPEIDMPEHEYCYMTKSIKTDAEVFANLNSWFDEQYKPKMAKTKDGKRYKRGMKCPTAIRYVVSAERLEFLNPNTKLVVGLRHPVLFFQSYYNYRVSHPLKIGSSGPPDPYDLIGNHDVHWQGVYTDLAKYEDSLMQLGKVELRTEDLREMAMENLNMARSGLDVFLYEIGQLSDDDEVRVERFREDMQKFLGLDAPIEPFEHRNVNVKAKETHEDMIDICDKKYDKLRKILLGHGDKTRHWIRDHFLDSDEVFLGGGEDHFLELIGKWGTDPCSSSSKRNH